MNRSPETRAGRTDENTQLRPSTVTADLIRVRSAVICGVALAALLLGGCAAPVGARRVSTRQAYGQIEANALRTGKPSASTAALLHRYALDRLAAQNPDEAVRELHEKLLATGERDLLFALSELSYLTGDRLRRNVKPWERRDARDYYLGSAVYAWLFLFGDCNGSKPAPFDSRFREGCDLYNYSLGLALAEPRDTNGVVQLVSSHRRLPVGEVELAVAPVNLPCRVEEFERVLVADRYRVRGLSVRNRQPGIGAPLVCVRPVHPSFGARPCSPATVLLRGPDSLAELRSGKMLLSLELYSGYQEPSITVHGQEVPLEIDLTTHWAYALNDSRIWKFGRMGFLAPAKHIPSQLILNQPYERGRIPVVLVHGTFSSPVTWVEMANSLMADPILRQRCQLWTFIYGSSNPLLQSIADLRSSLADQVRQLDPTAADAALRQMVVIGHSQGGLLTKGTAMRTEDRLWRVCSTNRFEDVDMDEALKTELRDALFLEPLPFVKRVVFIATPHRGSYLSGQFARRWAARLVSLPREVVSRSTRALTLTKGSEVEKFMGGRMPTSLDGMSPKNPSLLAMAEIPVVPEIKAHSIIPVVDDVDYRQSRDGVVAYQSAHLEGVESEFIVRSKHSCLNNPVTVEEVRRILHEHLRTSNANPAKVSQQ